MCKGEDEPGGPYRCSGHVRAALIGAEFQHAAATEATALARAEFRGIDEAYLELENGANMCRKHLEGDLDAEERASLEQEEAMFTDAAAHLNDEHESGAKKLAQANAAKEGKAAALHRAKLEYDATPDGLADLSREVAEQYELSTQDSMYKETWGERYRQALARRDNAETRMGAESKQRFERWVGSPEDSLARHDRQEWSNQREVARQQVTDSTTESQREGAKLGLENAELHIAAANREIAAGSKYAPYTAASTGEQSNVQSEAWQGVASIHRHIEAVNGDEMFEVTLSSTYQEERTRTTVRLPVSEFEGREAARAEQFKNSQNGDYLMPKRWPSTTEVLESLHSSASQYETAGGSRSAFYAQTGLASVDFDRASKAHKALGALLGSEGRAFAFETIDSKQLA